MKPKFTYDKKVDAAYLTVGKGMALCSVEIHGDPDIILDYDKDDKIIGIEILNFQRRFKR